MKSKRSKRKREIDFAASRRRGVMRRAALDQILGRMAEVAIERFKATGFCTDQDFAAAGFSIELIEDHGNRARERAVHVMRRSA